MSDYGDICRPDRKHDARALVVSRMRECGMGLTGTAEAISRWMFREHNIIATTGWISTIRKQERMVHPERSAEPVRIEI